MKKLLMNRSGNAVVVAVIAGALGMGGLALMLSKVSNFSQQVGKTESEAKAGDEINIVLQILQKKFEFTKEPNPNADPDGEEGEDLIVYGKPEWAPDYSGSIDPNNRPFIVPLGREGVTSWVATKLILGQKDGAGTCQKLPLARVVKTPGHLDCNIVDLQPDEKGVSALQKRDSLSETNGTQYGVLGLPLLANLSLGEQLKNFKPNFVFPVEKLASNMVQFLSFVVDSENPQSVKGVKVQINNVLAEIPIEAPPPPSQCTIALKNPSLEPIDLSARNVNVLFDVKANSIVQSAHFHHGPDDGELLGAFLKDQMNSQSVSDFGVLKSLKSAGFSLSLSNDETDIPSPDTPNEALKRISVTLTGLSSIPTDEKVGESPVLRNSQTCEAIIRTKKPSPPLCHLRVTNSRSVAKKGNIAKVELNCNKRKGGMVTSATVDNKPVERTYQQLTRKVDTSPSSKKQNFCQKNPDLSRCSLGGVPCKDHYSKPFDEPLCFLGGSKCSDTKIKQGYLNVQCYKHKDTNESITTTDLSKATSRIFKASYIRKTDGQAEVITASATGPGGTWTGQVGLGELCPYQDPLYSRQEFAFGDEFKDRTGTDRDGIEKAIADLTFTTGLINYTSHNTYWQSDDAASSSLAGVVTKSADGSWKGDGGNWDKAETCDSTNICMKIVQMTDDRYKYWKGGAKVYWIEVGPKSLANCAVLKTKMRHHGCFAGSTKLRMADGTEKLVSQIGENEWLYNPHYHAPVRVKGVVKGPEKKPLFEVSYGNQKVVVTEDHPFLTRSGWVQAMDLKADDILVGAGSGKKVKRVRQLPFDHSQDVWNFELDTEDPMGHLVLANEIPTGDLVTQQLLKREKQKVP